MGCDDKCNCNCAGNSEPEKKLMRADFDVDLLVDVIKGGLLEIGKKEADGFLQKFLDDSVEFTTPDVHLIDVNRGELEQDEFMFLVGGLEDLVKMHALAQAGVALVAIQRIQKAIIDLVISSAFKVVTI